MASVTPVNAGASDLFKSGTTSTPFSSTTSATAVETAPEGEAVDDSVQLSQQAMQLLEAAGTARKAGESSSTLTGPVTLAPQPELAAALEQAYGLSSGKTRRPVIRAPRTGVPRPKNKRGPDR